MKYYILSLLIIVSNALSANQPDTIKTYYLGELVITGKDETISSVASVNEISKLRMEELNAQSIEDAIRFNSGVYISRNTRNEAVINIRGFEQRQTALLYDGVPIYFAYDGLIDLSGISSTGLGKINITKSMPSAVYGANSMGGTINLISERTTNSGLYFDASLRYGLSKSLSFSNKGKIGILDWMVSALRETSDAFPLPSQFSPQANENGADRDNSDYQRTAVSAQAVFNLSEQSAISLNYSYNNNPKGIPINIYSTRPRFWRYSKWNKNTISLTGDFSFSDIINTKAIIFYDKYINTLDAFDDANFNTQNNRSSFTSTYDDYSFGASLLFSSELSTIGKSKLSIHLKDDIHNEQDNINLPYEEFTSRTMSVGLEQDFSIIDNLDFILGVSYDAMHPIFANDSSLRASTNSFNSNVGILFKPSDNFELYSHISGKSRFPTLKEFYSELMGTNLANPELKSERSINFEIGTRIKPTSELFISLALFRNDIRDLIIIVNLSDNKRQYQNFGIVEFLGFETSLSTQIFDINMEMNYTFLYTENKSENAQTKFLDNRPRHNFNLLINRRYDFGFAWSLESNFIGVLFGTNTDSRSQIRLNDYLIQNIKFSQTLFDNIEIFARVNNLLDRYYESEWGFPQPGRFFAFGINLNSLYLSL